MKILQAKCASQINVDVNVNIYWLWNWIRLQHRDRATIEKKEYDIDRAIIEKKEYDIDRATIEKKEYDIDRATIEKKEYDIDSATIEKKEYDIDRATIEKKEYDIDRATSGLKVNFAHKINQTFLTNLMEQFPCTSRTDINHNGRIASSSLPSHFSFSQLLNIRYSRPASGTTQPPIQRVPWLFLRG
jgi:hypothetical protein